MRKTLARPRRSMRILPLGLTGAGLFVSLGAAPATAPSSQPADPTVPTRVEAEHMQVDGSTAGRIEHQRWIGTGGEHQLWWHDRPGVGDTLTLRFDLPDGEPAGPRRVWGRFLKAPDYGTFKFDLNGEPAPAPVDLYAPQVTPAPAVDLGMHELRASGNVLKVEVSEANPASVEGQNMLGFDYITLTAPQAETAAGGALVTAGAFEKIYDPGVDEQRPWYINDHCFARGDDGTWHLFGITREEPARAHDEDNFAHATSPELTASPWQKQPFALTTRPQDGELHLWAPHVIKHDGLYWMFYCAGAFDDRGRVDSRNYRMHLATSPDLVAWTRHEANPLFTDGFDARDPMILKVDDEWIMYYTANDPPEGGAHIVAARTSNNLVDWSERRTVYTSDSRGRAGGPTESPFVVQRGDWYYLFVGPRGGYAGPYGYTGTDVFRSQDPFHFDRADHVGFLDAHAPEVVRNESGDWFISHCGWGQGGVYLAPLQWHDGLDGEARTDQPHDPDDADMLGQASDIDGARRVVYSGSADAGDELAMHVFTPDGWTPDDRRAAILYFHGGGWGGGSPEQFAPFAKDAAAHGMVAATVQYRLANAPGVTAIDAMDDARAAVAWVREHAAELGVDPQRIAVGGGSAGGQLAMACAYDDAPPEVRPDALVLMNPVLDLGDGRFARRFGGKEAAASASPIAQVPADPPPTIMFLGTADDLVPVSQAERYRDLARERGGRFELRLYEDATHGFFNEKRGEQPFRDVRDAARGFLQSFSDAEASAGE